MSTYHERYYERPPASHPILAFLTPIILLLALVVLAGWWLWPRSGSGLDSSAQPRPVEARGDLAASEKMNIEIYDRVSPSVVHVTNLAERRGQFSLDVQQVPRGTGTGFVWDTDGHIVTNYHVVEGADAAKVFLADHSSYDAKKIWGYPDKDIAVLWIEAPKDKLHPIHVGQSHDLKVGQLTFAIGNPFGLDLSMTTGIVSALGREIESANHRPIRGVIQTSAPINPGNSGGPLLDSAGLLIGMNTAILSPSGASAGIGFAIPVDEINTVVPQLIRHGKVVKPRLGVQIAGDQLAQEAGVSEGVLIIRVTPNSPAAQAGLRGITRDEEGQIHLGDILLSIDNNPINSSRDLYTVMDDYKVGDTVTVTILRDGKRQNVQVALQVGE
jgi:S1-C subfamily serine protease